MAGWLTGCGGGAATTPVNDSASPTARVPLERLWLLESPGVPPEDTVVSFPPDAPRVILLRRGAPDNTLFVELRFPAGSVQPSGPGTGDTVTMRVQPLPGLYAIELATDATIGDGAEVVFSYAMHFTRPLAAGVRYPNDLAFERGLRIGMLQADSTVLLLPSRRPGSDLLAAPLHGAGRYLVGATQ